MRKVVRVSDTPEPDRLSGPATPPNAAEIARYLPLSQRPRRDESGVTAHWGPQVAQALGQLADLLSGLSEADWTTPSAREGFRVADAAGLVVWRTATPRLARVWQRAVRAARYRLFPSAIELSLATEHAAHGRSAVADELRSHAETASTRSRSISDLAAVVLACYEISSVVGTPVTIDPVASGAVGLARSLSAPVEIRAVLATRSLVSTDGDWRVGKGSEISGTSAEIILFLYRRGPLPGSAFMR